jgi:hypothetical protein
MVPGARIELATKRYECLVLPLELTRLNNYRQSLPSHGVCL